MEFRECQTRDAAAAVANLLATAYQRFLVGRRIETAEEDALGAVNGELDNRYPESPHVHEVDA